MSEAVFRRAEAAGVKTRIGDHTFRGTGITESEDWHRCEPIFTRRAPSSITHSVVPILGACTLQRLEGSTPKIEAIAVTDYYVPDNYETFLSHKAAADCPT